jgi:hypothetical protein
MKKILILAVVCLVFSGASLAAAVGCDLTDPDRDVRRLFPESTGYRTRYLSIDRLGGPAQMARVESRLGDRFRGIYETIDVPYTVYEILKGKEILGYIHGVNEKGRYGGMQVFLALSLQGAVRGFYIQKLTARGASPLRSADFGKQFHGIRLEDFSGYDPVKKLAAPGSRPAGIRNPLSDGGDDFHALLRAVKKNLILMDEFVYSTKGAMP